MKAEAEAAAKAEGKVDATLDDEPAKGAKGKKAKKGGANAALAAKILKEREEKEAAKKEFERLQ